MGTRNDTPRAQAPCAPPHVAACFPLSGRDPHFWTIYVWTVSPGLGTGRTHSVQAEACGPCISHVPWNSVLNPDKPRHRSGPPAFWGNSGPCVPSW